MVLSGDNFAQLEERIYRLSLDKPVVAIGFDYVAVEGNLTWDVLSKIPVSLGDQRRAPDARLFTGIENPSRGCSLSPSRAYGT